MSEHEVAKHTKVIYKAWRDPNKNWKHKLGEIAVEILIIVFAISLSLLVERWREHAHEQKIEQQFLFGLKKDLGSDLTQLKEDSTTYATLQKGWNYFSKTGIAGDTLKKDSVKAYQWTFLNTTSFLPNSSRFEALKSSGELGVIENDSLQNLILDLYQNQIASLNMSTAGFSRLKNEQLIPYLFENLRTNRDSTSNLADLLQQSRMQNYLSYRTSAKEVLERYHNVIAQSRKIINMINEEYDLK